MQNTSVHASTRRMLQLHDLPLQQVSQPKKYGVASLYVLEYCGNYTALKVKADEVKVAMIY